ncbi:hypothetical protein [Oryzobacter terrae]|uniref:hypothetical protein n=1 Tax=Oryzobacter terrae TaxID=1620385 RepID=UPI00366E78B2
MSEHGSSPRHLEPLEVELLALCRTLVVDPPPADLADRVLARIAADERSERERVPIWRSRLGAPRRRALAAAVAALLVVVLVPPVRAAVLDLLRIGGVTVREVPSPPGGSPTTASERPVPTSSDGVVVGSLAEASGRVGFDIAPPPALGTPTTVAVTRGGRVVELTWGTGSGSTRLDVFDGSLSFGYLKSVWEAVTPTDVAGKEAVWFAAPHLIEWTDRSGATVTSEPRVAGPTLVWVDRGNAGREITYRLEGPETLAAATAVAESVP